MTNLIILSASLALVASCTKSDPSPDREPARAAAPVVKIEDPPHPSGPATAGKVLTASEWLTLRHDPTHAKDGEMVTVTFHTARDGGSPCYETNEANKWECVFDITGKRADGVDDFDTIAARDLNKAQTAVYTTKIKPDADVTLSCKILNDGNAPTLVDCR